MLNKKLKSARLAASFSQDQVIARLQEQGCGITKTALSYYENAKRTPHASMVRELAHIYGTTPAALFNEESESQIEWYSYRASLYRLGKRKREAIESYAKEKASKLMKIYTLVPSFKADFPKRAIVRRIEDSDYVAQQLRLHWKLGLDPIESVTHCFENHGAIVIKYSEEPMSMFDGLSAVVNKQFPLLIINSQVPADRLRFDLAHELGHILMDCSGITDDKEAERMAHRFASSFLVPPTVVKKELGDNRRNVTLSELLLLKEKYGMSVGAWVYSAFTHGVIEQSLFKKLFKNLSLKGWRKSEPGVFKGNETPSKLQQTALRLIAEGALSAQEAIDLFPELKNILECEEFPIETAPGRLRKMPLWERNKELEKSTEKAVDIYKTNVALTAFDVGDFYDYK